MCRYWKKLHTCNHESDRPYVEWCREGIVSHAICPDISEDPKRRNSHFPCYPCIKQMAREEVEEKLEAERDALAKAEEIRQGELKAKQVADRKAHEEKVRRDAIQKATLEREEESRMKKEKEESERQAKKEGGAWIESGSKRGKNKKNATASPSRSRAGASAEMKGISGTNMSPEKERSIDVGGRAGFWGPKKILSKKENENDNAGGSSASGTVKH